MKFALGLAMCLCTSVALADDDGGPKKESKARVSGRIVIIGPDGQKEEMEFDEEGELGDNLLKNVPEEMREHLEKAMQAARNQQRVFNRNLFNEDLDLKIDRFDDFEGFKGISEEAREQLEKAMKGHFDNDLIIGRGLFIGPDGVKRGFRLGGDEEDEVIIKRLPNEIRLQIDRVMKKVTDQELDSKSEAAEKKQPKVNSVERKLDLILQRLDQLEKEIDHLKKAR
ncbi:MAG: hypothetical protein MI861_25150, partial [Pirellulales bacterium]|nr:hypothetical protein [Pirellulales bacterium]